MSKSLETLAKEKLASARSRLLINEPWYGHMVMDMTWTADPTLNPQTAAVRFVRGNLPECLYYPPFIAGLTVPQIYGVLIHEVEHLIRLHPIRPDGRNPKIWNYAADMVVNGKRSKPYPIYRDGSNIIYPLEPDNMLWYDDKWKDGMTTEWVYDQLIKDAAHCVVLGNKSAVDSHEAWGNPVSREEARQIVKHMTDMASKQAGNIPGHLNDDLDRLSKPVVAWQRYLHEHIGRHAGNKRYTYSRFPRRALHPFGLKGVSHRACASLNIIIDTSGSVSQGQLEQFFSEIEMLSHKYKINLLQWDASFQGFSKYRRGDWKTIKINGRGGTDMEAPIQWLIQNEKVGDVQILFTDGEVLRWPTKQNFPLITCIVNATNMPPPSWGHTVYIR